MQCGCLARVSQACDGRPAVACVSRSRSPRISGGVSVKTFISANGVDVSREPRREA